MLPSECLVSQSNVSEDFICDNLRQFTRNHDTSPPVTCSGTRRQALIRRTWTIISTTYRLSCGSRHNDRHMLNYRPWNFLRRLRPPRTAGRRPALVFTDLSTTLASRVMAMAGTSCSVFEVDLVAIDLVSHSVFRSRLGDTTTAPTYRRSVLAR